MASKELLLRDNMQQQAIIGCLEITTEIIQSLYLKPRLCGNEGKGVYTKSVELQQRAMSPK